MRAVLSQTVYGEKHLVTHISCKLQKHEHNYPKVDGSELGTKVGHASPEVLSTQ